MALQLIIGGSGAGKSYCLQQQIIRDSIAHPRERYVLLVPEQFTMQTQKDLVTRHPAHGIMNIDVQSFQRLAYHVFDEVGGSRKVLEETGKSLVIRRLAQQNREKLTLLGSKLERMGYVGEMKSVLSELTQYRVGPELLEKLQKETGDNRVLADKLHDIQVLQEAFQAYKEETYITSEEILEACSHVIGKSRMVADSVVALDGFTGFTPVQYLLLERLMCCAREVIVTVTLPAQEYPFTALHAEELFAMSKQTIWELTRIAREQGIAIKEPLLLGREGMPRFAGADHPLAFLEAHLLRYDGAVYPGEQQAVRLIRAEEPRQEVRFVAGEIWRLIRAEGYRFRDIAVITGDMEGYAGYIEQQFADSRIACFIDHKRDILANPFVEFLRAALEMLEENFSYPSVFRYLRSGLTGIPENIIDRMDNYCRALGIRGYRRYEETWEALYQGEDPAELEDINAAREQLLSQVRELKETYSGAGKTVRQRTEGLCRWCARLHIQQQLKDRELSFQARGELALAREYAQVYRIVMELFDKLVELLGDEVIALKDYANILDAGLEEARVGIIPPGADQVTVGDIERTRLKDIKALFFVGVNEGIIPTNGARSGILSELDRESLGRHHLHLAPSRKENAYIQQFYLYLNVSRPSERLYVSFSGRNRKGEVLRPSYLVGMLRSLYPGCVPVSAPLTPASRRQGLELLARQLGMAEETENLPVLEGLLAYFQEEPVSAGKLARVLQAAKGQQRRTALDRAAVRAVYGETLVGSVTRLEKYASCAYAHFLSYGLRLKERQEYTFAAMDLGNVLHKALELYTGELEKSSYTWFDIPTEEQAALMDRCIGQVAEEYGNTILRSTARNTYMIDRMKQMGRRTVWAITEQIRCGRFAPRGFEISFSAAEHLDAVTFTLGTGTKMKLTGRIDRTDVYEDDGHVYVKVMDYKTGRKTFDVGEVYHGLSLQLAVYMNAALEMEQRTHAGKEIVPAAMLYYQIKDPIIDAEDDISPEQLEEERRKALCTKGLVNRDPDIIHLLDGRIGASSWAIPAGVTKTGALSARSSAADTAQMEQLFARVRTQMTRFGTEIMEGSMEARPVKKGEQTACDFCPYGGICGFDPKLPDEQFRRIPSLGAADVWEKLAQTSETGEQKTDTLSRKGDA